MNHVILQPCGSSGAASHYADTVAKPVSLSSIQHFLTPAAAADLAQIYPSGLCYVWGLTPGTNNVNVAKWSGIREGDVTAFSAKNRIFASAVVTYKLCSPALAEHLWGRDASGHTWEYIYFLDEVRTVHIPYSEFNRVVGYKYNNIIQGFVLLDDSKSEKFFATFGLRSETYSEPIEQSRFEQLQDKLDALEATDAASVGTRRLEQGYFKQHLFGRRTTATCGICGQEYPSAFLVAAHIKRRAACTTSERKDLNVVMPMCKFGCDDLFEKGYIAVEHGRVLGLNRKSFTPSVHAKIKELENRVCAYFTPVRESYFQFHLNEHRP